MLSLLLKLHSVSSVALAFISTVPMVYGSTLYLGDFGFGSSACMF